MTGIGSVVNTSLTRLFGLQLVRFVNVDPIVHSQRNGQWDYSVVRGWVGGRFEVPNHSNGYHGILLQWLEHYTVGSACLLVSENNHVKSAFELRYPTWSFQTLDKYDNLGGTVDIRQDICLDTQPNLIARFDSVLCQATLEHVYAPFAAVRNSIQMLRQRGVVLLHTHTPMMGYHAYPRDYVRFHLDWFLDLPQHIRGCELLELYSLNGHVFAALRKNE